MHIKIICSISESYAMNIGCVKPKILLTTASSFGERTITVLFALRPRIAIVEPPRLFISILTKLIVSLRGFPPGTQNSCLETSSILIPANWTFSCFLKSTTVQIKNPANDDRASENTVITINCVIKRGTLSMDFLSGAATNTKGRTKTGQTLLSDTA